MNKPDHDAGSQPSDVSKPTLSFDLSPEKLKKLQALAHKSDLTLTKYVDELLSKAIETDDIFLNALKNKKKPDPNQFRS